MKALGPVVAVLGAATLAGTAAAAEPIPIPPIPTTPTVTVPVPVPVPPTPSLPPPPAVPPSAPTAPPVAEPVVAASSTANTASGAVEQVVGSGSQPASSPPPSGSACCSFGGRTAGSTTSSSGGRTVEQFDSSRPWIGTQGSKRRRTTTLTFVLPNATRVLFTVNQVSPVCVGVGHFSIRGHKGLNRVRFAGRVHGESLTPGTYRISARTPDGRIVRRITLVVVDGAAPTRDELQALRAANVCADSESGTSFAAASSSAPATQLPSPASAGGLPIAAPDAPDINGGVLATSVEKTARAIRPLLVVLLAIAILLLALASTPQVAFAGGRTNDLLARHRTEIAAAGAIALLATAATFLLG